MSVLIKLAALLICCNGLVGCIQGPSRDVRSPEVSGKVMDDSTQAPLQGVHVRLHEKPKIEATTDSSGQFHLRGTKNTHLFTILGICSSSFPEGKN
jgi:hypothetical protein